MIYKYLRPYLIIAVITVLSAVTVAGILVADNNTRKIGFTDMEPVINVSSDIDTVIGIMDMEIRISENLIDSLSFAVDVYKKSAPNEVKASLALIGITEMLADRILR